MILPRIFILQKMGSLSVNKGKVVLVPFPFDDLSATKVRPAICLTEPVDPLRHVVLAFITSTIPATPFETDIVLYASSPDFQATGLKVSSTIRIHRLITVAATLLLTPTRIGGIATRHTTAN